MIVGLVLVLALALVLMRFVLPRSSLGKRWGRGRGPAWVTLLDRFTLEPRKHLYLVKVVERYWILGSSENSLHLVGELSKSEGEKIESQNL